MAELPKDLNLNVTAPVTEGTLLDHYAGLAMQALMSDKDAHNHDQIARTAFLVAEAMILNRRDTHRRLEIRRKRQEADAFLMYDDGQ